MTNADLAHGGALGEVMRAFPDAPTPWLDLSTGINPWPYPHSNIATSAFTALPDAGLERDGIDAMARAWNCAPETIALTAGSQAAIQILPRLFPSRRVAIIVPTYSEHAIVWRSAGAVVKEVDGLASAAHEFDTVVVGNPNNPDGRAYQPDALLRAAETLGSRGGRLIVDEAFADLQPDISLAQHAGAASIIVLRSFGKFFGLAGVRLGAIVASPDVIASARKLLGPWPVSGPALDLARRAYRDDAWRDATLARLRKAADDLDRALRAGGVEPVGGTDLFRWAACADAHATWRQLAARGIYVRRFSWSRDRLRFGLPREVTDFDRLTSALRA
ncbi:threonine-phosphate decarboxylase CobD [Terrarubrum flagellatum]|uniref:threonine-phosphate decarboxylase CobD n=1 Tax=Terrirubrum flagellatum TaxID=2895980 RepID=UPI0031456C56